MKRKKKKKTTAAPKKESRKKRLRSIEIFSLVLIIFALLAGEHSFGVWGALLAVPTASIIQSSFKYYRHEILGVPHEESHGHGKFVTSLLAKMRGRRSDPAKGTPA